MQRNTNRKPGFYYEMVSKYDLLHAAHLRDIKRTPKVKYRV